MQTAQANPQTPPPVPQPAPSNTLPPVRRAPTGERAIAAAVALACLAVLATAAFLQPSPEGHGTHEALGLPPCGFATVFELPCITCGMTTAFAHAANADFPRAFLTQPLGAALAIAAASAFWIAAYVAATGSSVGRQFLKPFAGRGLWLVLAAALAAWAFNALRWRLTM